jgi:DNA-binding transcriptional LysR family regulator
VAASGRAWQTQRPRPGLIALWRSEPITRWRGARDRILGAVDELLDAGEPLSSNDLAAFVLAVETGSLSAAAQELELTQSAVTKRIASLERRLATRLLERGSFGARSTEAGRLLYPEAKQALAALRHAASVVATHSAQAPALRLAASHTIGEFLLPGWIGGFRLTQPDPQRAQVEVTNSRRVMSLVREGAVEIGFVESRHRPGELVELQLGCDEIVCVVAVSHPWARRTRVPARALLDDRYVARERGSGTRAVASEALEQAGIELRPTFEVTSTQGLKRAVLDGGFTLISRLAVEAEERSGTLRALPVSGVDLRRALRAVRRRSPISPSGQRFWRHLVQRAGDQTGAVLGSRGSVIAAPAARSHGSTADLRPAAASAKDRPAAGRRSSLPLLGR